MCSFFDYVDDSDGIGKLGINIEKLIDILGFPPQIGAIIPEYKKLSEVGCTTLFSGHGGDQCLSNNACNVLISLINQGRLLELHKWDQYPFHQALIRKLPCL